MNGDDRIYEQQAEIFQRLYERTEDLLERFGRADSLLESGDYSVWGDYWGHPQVKITVDNLKMLRPNIVSLLQKMLGDFPGWEFVIAVAVRGHYDWPEMGLIVRGHEIIDGLQRQYFPREFQDLHYEGSRLGTDRD